MDFIDTYIELKILHKSSSSLFYKLPEHLMDEIINRTGLKNKIGEEISYYKNRYFATSSKLDNLLWSVRDRLVDTSVDCCANTLCEEAGIDKTPNLCESCDQWFCEDCMTKCCGKTCNECGDCSCDVGNIIMY